MHVGIETKTLRQTNTNWLDNDVRTEFKISKDTRLHILGGRC